MSPVHHGIGVRSGSGNKIYIQNCKVLIDKTAIIMYNVTRGKAIVRL